MTVSGQNELSYLGVRAPNPPNLIKAQRAPTAQDANYQIGTIWVDNTGGAAYILVIVVGATATWDEIGAGVGIIATINTNNPIAGNYTLAGTAAQIAVAQTAGTSTFSLVGPYTPATYTDHGILLGSGAASIRALGVGATGTLLSGVTGADPAFTASPSVTGTVTAGTGITSTTGNIVATAGQVNAGTTMTAGTGITATTGNIVASTGNITSTLGSVAAATTVTAGTSMTATAGDITATLGNVIINGAAKQLRVHGGAATDFIGQTTLALGVSPAIANTNIAATDKIFLSRQGVNGSTALGVFDYVITPATSFQITARKPADASAETGDTSIVDYFIVRQV